MNANDLKSLILSLTQDIEFEYLGRQGSIVPISHSNLSLCYGDDCQQFDDIDKLMEAPLLGGMSLNQISNAITI